MKKLEVKDNIWWIGAIDHKLRVFDIIMYTEFGTTYNSYLVKGSEKVALIETVKHTFTEEYLKKLQEEIDVTTIDYIVVDHTEPDHVGTVGALLDLAPQAVVVGSAPAIRFLKMIANKPFKYMEVGDHDELSLGDKTLSFISAPFLHWPDSIYTYVKEDKVLFTCDSFGSHYAFDDILYSKVTKREDYQSALRYYFNMIFGPFKKYMLDAIAKIEHLDIDMICNGHGPVLDENPMAVVAQYKEWCQMPQRKEKKIVIPYVSAYGYTKQLAQSIKRGIETVGGIHIELYDLVDEEEAIVLEAINNADGVLFGSPTINGDALYPIMKLLIQLSPLVHNHIFTGAFGSFGWSGEAVDNITRRLTELRTKVVPGLKINFKPDDGELIEAVRFGENFATLVNGSQEYLAIAAEGTEGDEEDYFVFDGTIKKWRCVVCGEVFEGVKPPAICPACGATVDQFEVYEEAEVTYRSTETEHIVIIGNGAAGVAAAEAVRERNDVARVTIIDKEEELLYYKPMLAEHMADDLVIESIYLHDRAWYDEKGFELLLGVTVTNIDPENKVVTLSSGAYLDYTKLVVAAGSYSFVPPIKNAHLEGVFTLRTMADANNIKAYAQGKKRAVVVGGGLLGLETADELQRMGLEISVVEIANRLLPRQIDERGAAIFEEAVKAKGIKLIKGCAAKEVYGHHKVEHLALGNGEVLEADVVLISAGILADTTLAEKAGIECERSIVVDSHMRTNIEGIFAAGDVAEFEGVNYAIWPEAVEQGKVAGANAIGDNIAYHGFIPSNVFNNLGVNVFSIGQVNLEGSQETTNLLFENPETGIYKRLLFKNNAMIGGILIGDNKQSKKLIEGIKMGANPHHLLKVLR